MTIEQKLRNYIKKKYGVIKDGSSGKINNRQNNKIYLKKIQTKKITRLHGKAQ